MLWLGCWFFIALAAGLPLAAWYDRPFKKRKWGKL
jgi:hypothetical protein